MTDNENLFIVAIYLSHTHTHTHTNTYRYTHTNTVHKHTHTNTSTHPHTHTYTHQNTHPNIFYSFDFISSCLLFSLELYFAGFASLLRKPRIPNKMWILVIDAQRLKIQGWGLSCFYQNSF